LQGSLEHGPQGRLKIDRVVCNKNAALHYARHQCLITAFIDFLLGVEKAEGDVFAARKVIQSITVHKLDNITDTSRTEGLPRELSLLIQYLACRNFPADSSASQSKPERGVSRTCSNLNATTSRCRCCHDGDELMNLTG